MLTRTGVDPLDPQGAETPLFVAAVAIGILQAFLDPLDGDRKDVLAAAAIPLGELDNFFVAGACGDAPMHSCHDGVSLSGVGQKVALDDPCIGITHQSAAARISDHLLGTLAHAMALAGLIHTNPARRRHAEPFLGSGFGLQLGHFSSFHVVMWRSF
jgi:hypothetical protein